MPVTQSYPRGIGIEVTKNTEQVCVFLIFQIKEKFKHFVNDSKLSVLAKSIAGGAN